MIHLSSSSTNPLTRTFSPFSTKVCLIYEENFVLSRFKVDLTLNFYESEHFNLLILCNLGPAPRMTFCVVMLRSLRFRNPVVPASMNPYTSCFCEWTLLCTDLKHKQECVRHHIFIPTQEEVDRVSNYYPRAPILAVNKDLRWTFVAVCCHEWDFILHSKSLIRAPIQIVNKDENGSLWLCVNYCGPWLLAINQWAPRQSLDKAINFQARPSQCPHSNPHHGRR